MECAEKNVALLKQNNSDAKAIKKFVEASVAFTILFNRKRNEDVQYVEIDSYLGNVTITDQTEFLEEKSVLI